MNDPIKEFHSRHYLNHNARRLEHLASLRIPVSNKSVLEVGAGIGDHSGYYIFRNCPITITEARAENLELLKARYPGVPVQFLDMDNPSTPASAPFDLVHCYGLLYHLQKPEQALKFLGRCTQEILFLETCVSFGDDDAVNLVEEDQNSTTQSFTGLGCRPTRPWLFKQLHDVFEYVYVPKTQPYHGEFPLDWSAPEKHKADLQRAIFIASREPLKNEILTQRLISKHVGH